ncbi:MAG: sugar ABC transporter substrate-binding protein [Candidatus Eisenbacteria bacterium]
MMRRARFVPPGPGLGLARGLALAGALALAGCAGSGDSGRTTIRFWAMGKEGEVVRELADQFEREHPNVRIEVQAIPWSAAHEKLLTAYVGRSSPDVSQLGNTWIPEFQALNALEPLSARVAASPDIPRAQFFDGIWETNVVDGETYGVPWYVDTRVVFYRKDLLARAGYAEMPGDWAGWRAAMQAIVKMQGKGHTAILLPVNEWTVPVVLGLQAGSPLVDEHLSLGRFEGPEFRRALDFYLGLFKDGLAPAIANTEISNLYQEFSRGTFAMYVTGPWNISEFKSRMPDSLKDAWGTAPMPGPDGPESGVSTAGGASLVLFKASQHKAEAWQFVEFLSRPSSQARFFELARDLPARRDAWLDSALVNDPRAAAFRTQLERVRSTPRVPEWEFIATRLQERVEARARGAQTSDSAMAGLDRDVNTILEKRRWLQARAAGR